ncbi:hypothetical protein JTB14_019509 [Gonioctena quinquepunctata]|nr:hypothetical protein JTB14_019509 [Gonioctena quinquepunctata]
MATLDTQVANLEQFDEIGFSNCEFRFKLFLEQSGTLKEDVSTQQYELLEVSREDAKARNIMVQWLAENVLKTVKNKKTAKEMYEIFKKTHIRR